MCQHWKYTYIFLVASDQPGTNDTTKLIHIATETLYLNLRLEQTYEFKCHKFRNKQVFYTKYIYLISATLLTSQLSSN